MRALMIAVLALVLGGCNTVEGFGKDVQKAGTALERAADKGK